MTWRFMAAIMGVALVVLLVQDIPLFSYLRQVENDRIMTSLERDAFVLAARSEESLESTTAENHAQLAEIARTYRDAGGARVVIVDIDGTAIVTSDDDQSVVGTSYASRPEIAKALGGEINSGTRFSQTLQEELLYVTVPIFSGPTTLGAVRLTYSASVVTDAVNDRLSVLGIVALTTVLLAGAVGFILSSSVTRKLNLVRAATERLAEGDLSARADEHAGAPEIRSLSKSFNAMAVRLETLISQQRTFAADASHQLRTPLTALRLRLERARELMTSDPDAAAERLAAAEAETDRLSNIVEGLLLLSRSEASSAPVGHCDLGAIAAERVAQWQALGQEIGVGVEYDGPVSAMVMAVATAPEQIIDNFVDNALSVSPAGSTITVRVEADGTTVELHVLDRGPGLTEEECSRAFDRFWRGSSDAQGNGLGLSIVAQLARSSFATAQLAPRAGGGLDASVTFETEL